MESASLVLVAEDKVNVYGHKMRALLVAEVSSCNAKGQPRMIAFG